MLLFMAHRAQFLFYQICAWPVASTAAPYTRNPFSTKMNRIVFLFVEEYSDVVKDIRLFLTPSICVSFFEALVFIYFSLKWEILADCFYIASC